MFFKTQSRINTLAGNLQELYAVAQSNDPCRELIPDPWGRRFYSSKSWLGRFFVFIYRRLDRFNAPWRNKAITKVMERTHRIYYELFTDAYRHNITMKQSFQARVDGRYIREDSLRAAKSFLTDWNAATTPFLKGMDKVGHKFREFLSTGFYDTRGRAPARVPFSTSALAKEFSRHQKVIDFEGHIGSALPVSPLFKVATRRGLTRRENEALTSFSGKIERCASTMKIRNFNKYLRALVKCFKRLPYGASASLVTLATTLVKRKHTIFNQRDSRHICWRNRLRPGDRLDCNGMEVVLGEPMGRKNGCFDNNLVFNVANAPNLVAVFGVNKLILPLKAQLAEEMGFGIRSAEYVQIEKKGKFALVERLMTKLSDHVWQTRREPLLSVDFEKIVPIVNAIRWFIAQNRTPAHFHPDYLMYDARGELKSTKYNVPLPFSFIDLENYARTIAGDNPHVFKYIMEKSQLKDHPHARFFREVVTASARGEDPEVQRRSQVYKVENPFYVDRARELIEDIAAIKAECLVALRQVRSELPRNIEQIISDKFIDVYQNTPGVSILAPQIDQWLLRAVLTDLRPRKMASAPKNNTPSKPKADKRAFQEALHAKRSRKERAS